MGNHPPGLRVLFLTELWERFSYYGMRAILIFYLTRQLRFEDTDAYLLYGSYVSLIYALPVLGGLLADRLLGARPAVTAGAVLLVLGHFTLAFEAQPPAVGADGALVRDAFGAQVLYLALALLCVGTGLLKANVSTLVGSLYPRADPRRESAFTIFYFGINLGALAASLLVGWLGERAGWSWGFGAAGVGMLLGLGFYLGGRRHLAHVGAPPVPGRLTARGPLGLRTDGLVGAGILATVLAVWQLIQLPALVGTVLGSVATLAVGSVVAVALLRLVPVDRDRMLLLLFLSGCSVLFWALFEQAGSSLNLFTDRNVDRAVLGREIPAAQFQALNAGFILLLAPVFALLWPFLACRGLEPSAPAKFAVAIVLAGAGFWALVVGAVGAVDGRVALGWLVLAYFLHTTGELCLSPVGLATVTRLSVPGLVGLMMGIWYLSIAGAGWIGGLVASAMDTGETDAEGSLTAFTALFRDLGTAACVAGAVLLLAAPLLRRAMHPEQETPAEGIPAAR